MQMDCLPLTTVSYVICHHAVQRPVYRPVHSKQTLHIIISHTKDCSALSLQL